ncbi:MAG: cupin domain-containing protein [Candidatus Aminicenantales bacterium]
MVIKRKEEIREEPVEEKEVKDVMRRILIGPDDGKTSIIMRHFKLLPGGHTPLHSHTHEHVVKVESGRGVVVDEYGKENVVSEGYCLLIEGGRNHQFRNPYHKPFEFLCIIKSSMRELT